MKINNYFKGGLLLLLAACSKKDDPIAQKFNVDESVSVAEWRGSAPTHYHTGSFKVKGSFQTNGTKQVTGGDFTIPIASIENFDLTGVPKTELLDHLKSPDFFNLALHPTATFHITKVEPGTNNRATVTGDFTMLGQKHPVQIPAKIVVEKDRLYVEGTFNLNRLTWGMNKYNDPAGTLYILPDVVITLKVQGTPSK